MDHELTIQELEKFSTEFNENPKNKVVARAAQRSGVKEASYNENVQVNLNRVFSTELDVENVTNQKQSGRCWEFATLNILRHNFGKKYHVKNFTFSQSYNFFWDKIERANIFYDNILNTANEELNSRTVQAILSSAGQDGGQFKMAAALIEKYGVVPSYAMPESFNTNNTDGLKHVLEKKLKKDALVLRELKQAGKDDEIAKTRDQFLSQVYQITAIAVGEPPKKFDLEYRDDDKKYHLDKNLTPLEFLHKYLPETDFDDYVDLTNAPNREYNKLYAQPYSDNVEGLYQNKFLNVSMEFLTSTAVKQLKDGEAVWFGSNVGEQSDRKKGYLDSNLYQLSELFGVDLKLSKGDALATDASYATHAMALVGVDEDHGDIRQWKVENSWGPANGEKGFFVMSNDWFNENTFEVVVHKKYLTSEQRKIVEGPAIELPAWDSIC